MASFRDVYTREVESLFGNLDRSRFEDIPSDTGVPQGRPVGDGNIQPISYVAPGVIDIENFATSIIPPRVVDTLPTLPDTDYAQGSLVFLTTDEKLYRNTDGSTWSVAVDGEDIIANSITAGQIAAGAIGTDQLAADAVIANVINAGGTVTIDSTGITLLDAGGQSVLTTAGFGGSWVDFLTTRAYNGLFRAGTLNVEIPVSQVGSGVGADYEASLSDLLPYWVVSDSGGSLLLITDSDAPWAHALYFNGSAFDGRIYQDVPVVPGRYYNVTLNWRYESLSTDEFNRDFTLSWRDSDHDIIGSPVSEGVGFLDMEQATYTQETFRSDIAPTNAAYLRVSIGMERLAGSPDVWVAGISVFESSVFGDYNVDGKLTVDTVEAGDVTAGAISLPRGVVGWAQVTASQGSITSEVDLTSLSTTVQIQGGRLYRITGEIFGQSTVADDRVAVNIKEGSTQLQTGRQFIRISGAPVKLACSVILSPSAGSHTYKLTAMRATGTGTMTMAANTTFPAFILVEDIGEA